MIKIYHHANRIGVGMVRRLTTIAFFAIALCSLAVAQRTWIVDRQNAPGTDFTDLIPAVDAAASGDTILLVPRPSVSYQTPGSRFQFIQKSLRIIGLGADPVRTFGGLNFLGAPREHMIVLANLDIELKVVTAEQCLGTIVLDRLIPPARSTLPYSGSLQRATDCGNVVIANCDFRMYRGAAVDINRGRSVFVQNSRIENIYSNDVTSFPSGALLGSEVQMWITQSQITGGVPRFLSQWDMFYDWGVAVGHPRNGRVANLFIGPGNSISGAPHPSGGSAGFPFRVTCTHPTHQNSVKQAYSQIPSIPVEPSMLAYDPSSTFIGCRDNDNNEILHEFASVIPGQALRGQSQTLDLWGPTSSILAVYVQPGTWVTLLTGHMGDTRCLMSRG